LGAGGEAEGEEEKVASLVLEEGDQGQSNTQLEEVQTALSPSSWEQEEDDQARSSKLVVGLAPKVHHLGRRQLLELGRQKTHQMQKH
jgi:hypothetical protein